VIEFAPTASVEMLNVVFPALIAPVPRVVLPSVNVTVPVAVAGVIVAVNFTDEPYAEGFADEASVMVGLALFTIWVSTEDVLPLYFVLPPYEAVIECEPAASFGLLKVACPLLSVPVPRVVPPSLNVTVPVAKKGVTIAVNVTELP